MERKLYKTGDSVPLEFQLYPGPKLFRTVGKVIACMSPTYYRIEYLDERGKTRTRNFIRSQLP